MTHCFFARPVPFLLTTVSATTLGIAMAAASKPIATALSMKLALTVAGTASLATGLLAAGIVLAALGTLAIVLGLLLCGRMRMREKHRYVQTDSLEGSDSYGTRKARTNQFGDRRIQ